MFDDANLDKAIMGAGMGLLAGSGQNCSCTSRIYVQRGIYDQVVDGLAGFAKMLPMGGNDDPNSVLGPLISEKQRQRVSGIVNDGVAGGAQVVTGGKPMDRRGYFYEATIVTNTTPDMRLIREEIFGPVGCVIPFDEEDEAIAAANDTEYGLVAYVYTSDLKRAFRVCERLQTGMIGLNQGIVSNAAAPFGGVKASGFGREGGREGIDEYLSIKYVAMAM
jgi:aldehyde dehydrogenase (NAD+)